MGKIIWFDKITTFATVLKINFAANAGVTLQVKAANTCCDVVSRSTFLYNLFFNSVPKHFSFDEQWGLQRLHGYNSGAAMPRDVNGAGWGRGIASRPLLFG